MTAAQGAAETRRPLSTAPLSSRLPWVGRAAASGTVFHRPYADSEYSRSTRVNFPATTLARVLIARRTMRRDDLLLWGRQRDRAGIVAF